MCNKDRWGISKVSVVYILSSHTQFSYRRKKGPFAKKEICETEERSVWNFFLGAISAGIMDG